MTGERDRDQRRIWHYFQNERPESFEGAAPRLDAVAKVVARLARKQGWNRPAVLNIGIGNGYFEESIQRRGGISYSLDPDAGTVERLRQRNLNAEVGRIDAIPFASGMFNAVVVSEVLEHLEDSERRLGLREIVRVLKPSGFIVGTLPHDEDLSMGMCVCPQCGHYFHRWGHTTSFTRESIRSLLSLHFDVIFVARTAFVRLRNRPLLGKLSGMVRSLLAKAGYQFAEPRIFFAARVRDVEADH